jgi:hypothetical protein
VTIKLFDLPGTQPDPWFSPYCWRSWRSHTKVSPSRRYPGALSKRKQLRCPGGAGCRVVLHGLRALMANPNFHSCVGDNGDSIEWGAINPSMAGV